MTERRCVLGMCNVFRKFFQGYSKIAFPLYKLTKKGQPIKVEPCGEAVRNAFEERIERVSNPPVLALPRNHFFYTLDTEAAEQQIRAALSKEDKPSGIKRQPFGYWSRSWNDAETIYSTLQNECLTIVWSFTTWRPYLQRSNSQLNADQASLRWLLSTTEFSGTLMRWRLRLSDYDFERHYKKGIHNSVAEYISRATTENGTTGEIEE